MIESDYLFAGIGMSTYLPVCLTIVQLYFDKRRALAAGIATAGFSMATLTIPMLIKYLLDYYTLQGVLLLLSVLPIQVRLTNNFLLYF